MISPANAHFWDYYNLLLLVDAIGMTIALTVGGCGIGYIFGFGLALLRIKRVLNVPPLRWLSIAFVEFVRRIPFLVLLFLVLFGFQATKLTLSSAVIAGIAIAVRTAAISSEN